MSTDLQDLQSAWRALSGPNEEEGWRTIPITTNAPCRVLAGRRAPGNEEAVIIGLNRIASLPASQLPQGQGFEVVKLPTSKAGSREALLALARRPSGSLELFTSMAEDVISLLEASPDDAEDRLFIKFLSRIRAWQDFMDHHRDGVLSAESEQGLFGELVTLKALIEAGMHSRSALEAWQGPDRGLHDFIIGNGAIEVKAALTTGQFLVTISSLDQLDDRLRHPLYLATVRLALDEAGHTLPGMAELVRESVGQNEALQELLDVRLLRAGLLPMSFDRYSRRFRLLSLSLLPVDGSFPRLTRAEVHHAIREVTYKLDLDMAGATGTTMGGALSTLGAI